MSIKILAVILLHLLVGLSARSTSTSTSNREYLLDINHNSLDLKLGTIYAIHNHATDLPLLHDRPGTNVTRLSHWWTLTPLEDNIYYLQIQEIRANHSAPRWERRVRMQASSTPGYYHLYPISCFRYQNANSTNSFLYVDYYDENGRDNSECISLNSTKNGWRTKLEEEDIFWKPREILSKDNFEYKFTTLNEGLEERLRNSEKSLYLTTARSETTPMEENHLLLPKLNLHEEEFTMAKYVQEREVKMKHYDCQCREEIRIERPYFTFSIPSRSSFRLNIGSDNPEDSSPFSHVTIVGWMGGRIENNVQLKDPRWTLKWKNQQIPQHATTLSILNINGLGLNSASSNSTNYFTFDKNRNDFGFLWTSSSTTTQIQVRFGTPEKEDLCSCYIPLLWYIHPINIMGGLIFMVFATVLIYTRVVRGRSQNGGFRDTSFVDGKQSTSRGKVQDKVGKVLHRWGLTSGSEDGKDKKIMLQNF